MGLDARRFKERADPTSATGKPCVGRIVEVEARQESGLRAVVAHRFYLLESDEGVITLSRGRNERSMNWVALRC